VREFEPVVDGLVFTECPRWHDGRVWYSDTHVGEVHRFDPATGVDEIVARHSSSVAGLGFLPDGRLLAVSSMARKLLRLEPDGFVEHADMSAVVGPWPCNDMAVDSHGRAYVGGFGYDIFGGAPMVPTRLVLVTPDGVVRAVGDEVTFPNGTIIAPPGITPGITPDVTPDGATLIVAETMSEQLVAFTIADDGSLVDRRVYAHVDGMVPDGICLDAEGAVWVAHPRVGALRLLPGGEVSDRIELPGRNIYACVLGGADRRTLFACTGTTHDRDEAGRIRSAKLEAVTVDVPGAGVP
jgi:sugar lactone lactonase YvrE